MFKVSELFTAVRDEKKSTVPQILNKSLHNVSGSTSLCGNFIFWIILFDFSYIYINIE